MRHDPERAAAAYLAGELRPADRERFEAHVLGCDDCWREVTAGRQGRALAEGLREVAPQRLRERIRATIAAAPPPPRRRLRVRMPALLGISAALAAVLAAAGLLAIRAHAPAQPAPITAAVAAYHADEGAWSPTTQAPPARQLGDLTWRGSGQGELAGLPVVAHTYRDSAGRSVLLLQAGRSFPQAHGASHQPTNAVWTAKVDGVALFCADHPGALAAAGRRPGRGAGGRAAPRPAVKAIRPRAWRRGLLRSAGDGGGAAARRAGVRAGRRRSEPLSRR